MCFFNKLNIFTKLLSINLFGWEYPPPLHFYVTHFYVTHFHVISLCDQSSSSGSSASPSIPKNLLFAFKTILLSNSGKKLAFTTRSFKGCTGRWLVSIGSPSKKVHSVLKRCMSASEISKKFSCSRIHITPSSHGGCVKLPLWNQKLKIFQVSRFLNDNEIHYDKLDSIMKNWGSLLFVFSVSRGVGNDLPIRYFDESIRVKKFEWIEL